MKKHEICPGCGREPVIKFRPTRPIFKRINFANGMFCSGCNTRVQQLQKKGYYRRFYMAYIPYIIYISWNIFVSRYGMKHYGLEKIDPFWGVAFFIITLFILSFLESKYYEYVIHKKQKYF